MNIAPDKWDHLLFFLFLHKNIYCGYSLEVPSLGTSNEYPQHVFMEKYEKYWYFLVEKGALSGAVI